MLSWGIFMLKRVVLIPAGCVLLVVFIGFFLFNRSGDGGEGVVFVGIGADGIKGISGSNGKESVALVFERVEVWNEQEGWKTILDSETRLLFDASAQAGEFIYLDKNPLASGEFTRIRFLIQRVQYNADGEEVVALPSVSEFITIPAKTVVVENAETSILVNFAMFESLHELSSEGIAFIPVLDLEIRSDTDVTIDAAKAMHVEGGEVTANARFGMRLDGSMHESGWYTGEEPIVLLHGIIVGKSASQTPSLQRNTHDASIQDGSQNTSQNTSFDSALDNFPSSTGGSVTGQASQSAPNELHAQ